MPIRKGEDWGTPVSGPPDFEVMGGDSELAGVLRDRLGGLINFRPLNSDLALAIGLRSGMEPPLAPTTELPMDALRTDDGFVVNMVVFGTPPDRLSRWSRSSHFTVTIDGADWFSARATTVVVANGQFLHGVDLVPKGHPNDGRAEVQVWQLAAGERAAARDRLHSGSHVPHPRIRERKARRVEVRVRKPVRFEGDDGGGVGTSRGADLEIVPSAYRLLV
jgi:hypothetical protein